MTKMRFFYSYSSDYCVKRDYPSDLILTYFWLIVITVALQLQLHLQLQLYMNCQFTKDVLVNESSNYYSAWTLQSN